MIILRGWVFFQGVCILLSILPFQDKPQECSPVEKAAMLFFPCESTPYMLSGEPKYPALPFKVLLSV